MSEKKEKVLYDRYKVCRADFDRLHQLDSAEAKLRSRAELAAKTLADLSFDDIKNVKTIQRYIDTTFPNSLKLIKEKKQIILSKYRKRIELSPMLVTIVFNVAFVAIALSVIGIAISYLVKTAG